MSYWATLTEEQKVVERQKAAVRRARAKATRTPEQAAALSAQRRQAREKRKQTDNHKAVARQYVRTGKGWLYSWAHNINTRAKAIGVPCDIDADWLQANMPTHCPVLGIELKRRTARGDNEPSAPTVDRLDPALGYVKGNIHIISRRANNIKSDATVDEIVRVAQWMQALTTK